MKKNVEKIVVEPKMVETPEIAPIDMPSETTREDESDKRRKKALIKQKIFNLIPLMACVVLALMYIISASIKGYNLSIGIKNVISSATLVALVATAGICIFTAGSFDLSLGSNMLVSAALGGLVGIATHSLILMVLTSIGVAVVLSVLNSALASIFKLPVFIMTIVMMNVYSSIAKAIFTKYGTNSQIAVPIALVTSLNNVWFRIGMVAVYVIFCCVLFYFMKLGRQQKFLGGNPFCAFLSGIKPNKITIISFALAGIGVGLAAFCMTVQTPTLSGTSGSSVGMNMLIAIVFGGMNMNGGPKSKMYAALLGSISMSFLDAFMNIFVSGDWYLEIVKGLLFVGVVFAINIGNKNKLLER